MEEEEGCKDQEARQQRHAAVGTWYSIYPRANLVADPHPPLWSSSSSHPDHNSKHFEFQSEQVLRLVAGRLARQNEARAPSSWDLPAAEGTSKPIELHTLEDGVRNCWVPQCG